MLVSFDQQEGCACLLLNIITNKTLCLILVLKNKLTPSPNILIICKSGILEPYQLLVDTLSTPSGRPRIVPWPIL